MINIRRYLITITNRYFSTVLPIVKIDQLEGKNRQLHNTNKFITNQFVIRRGQSFFMDIHLARPFNLQTDNFHITLKTGKKPREFDKSFVHIQRVDEFDALNKTWAYKIISVDKNIIHIEVNCPADVLIAKYEMSIEDDEEIIYTHHQPFVILFNPWNQSMLYFYTHVVELDMLMLLVHLVLSHWQHAHLNYYEFMQMCFFIIFYLL